MGLYYSKESIIYYRLKNLHNQNRNNKLKTRFELKKQKFDERYNFKKDSEIEETFFQILEDSTLHYDSVLFNDDDEKKEEFFINNFKNLPIIVKKDFLDFVVFKIEFNNKKFKNNLISYNYKLYQEFLQKKIKK
jgi:hypothetical protein